MDQNNHNFTQNDHFRFFVKDIIQFQGYLRRDLYIINMSAFIPPQLQSIHSCQSKKELRRCLKQTQDMSDYSENSPVMKPSQLGNLFLQLHPSVQEIYSHEFNRVLLTNEKNSESRQIIKITPIFEITNSKGIHQKQQLQFLSQLRGQKCQHIIDIAQITQKQNEQICIMEYGCGGDLEEYCQMISNTLEKSCERILEIKNVLWQIILGLEQIHSMGYVHRDLKPTNLVFSHTGSIKFCDFGLAIKVEEIDPSLCGTPEYMPPQRLTNKRKSLPIDYSIDMWSLGVLAYELFMGETPFCYEDDDVDDLVDQIYGGYFSFDEEYPEQIRHFVCNLLQPNPARRMTLEKAKEHKIFKKDFNPMKQISSRCKCWDAKEQY